MRRKTIQWLMAASAIFGMLWIGGLVLTLGYYFGDANVSPSAMPVTAAVEPQQPAPAPPATTPPAATSSPTPAPAPAQADNGSFRLLALGDSLTRGTGDPQGTGYVGHVVESLKAKSKQPIVADNYGVNGQTTAQLAAALQTSDVQSKVKEADMIVVSIGANDLFRGGQTLNDMSPQNIQTIQDGYARQLDGILKELRKHNPDANLFLIGLYNPFIALQDNATTSKIVRDWNYRTAEVASGDAKTVIVPTFDLFQLKVQDYLARDLFHPNGAGYRLIGERLASLVNL